MISEKEFGGAFKFGDIFEAGGGDDFSLLSEMKSAVQMDDAVNIQFTSVSGCCLQFSTCPPVYSESELGRRKRVTLSESHSIQISILV